MADLKAGLTRSLITRCGQSKTVVSLPVAATEGEDVQKVTLNDPSCRATENGTHWILKSPRYV